MILMYQTIGLLAGIAIFWQVEPALNVMSSHSRLSIRLAFWLLAVGAGWLVLTITQGYIPTPPILFLAVGVALLLLSNERRTA